MDLERGSPSRDIREHQGGHHGAPGGTREHPVVRNPMYPHMSTICIRLSHISRVSTICIKPLKEVLATKGLSYHIGFDDIG